MSRAQTSEPIDIAYRAHRASIRKVLLRLGVHRDEVEDLSHEVFLVMLRRWHDARTGDNPLPWLKGVAQRVYLNHRRAGVRRARCIVAGQEADATVFPDLQPTPERAVEQRRALSRARGELSKLDREERATVEMFLLEGYTALEVADALGITPTCVNLRVRSGRRKLMRVLSPNPWTA